MPDLAVSLQGRDLGHLRIVAQLWGLELNAPDARVGLQRLVPILLERQHVKDVVAGLPAEARSALDDLLQNDGLLSWPLFSRRYGRVREMGPGRRDRERPYMTNPSPAEDLWYRALVSRAFFDTPSGAEEFAYVPEDLLPLLPAPEAGVSLHLGRPASPAERIFPIPASDRIIDDTCTLLAGLRLGLSPEQIAGSLFASSPTSPHPVTPQALARLLSAANLLDSAGLPQPEPARAFLEAERSQALALLAQAWLDSQSFNELRMLPGLKAEGEWQNDPLRARLAVLSLLIGRDRPAGTFLPASRPVPGDSFRSLPAFVAAVRQVKPDFQRPAGDYDSWFIRDESSGEFLRGFEHWDEVDGALVRFLITGLLHWLGIMDLAAPSEGAFPTAFRFSKWADSLLAGAAPDGLPAEDATLLVRSDARVQVPRLVPRAVRYQIARFCVWDGASEDTYHYRLTPASLERARRGGLRLNHLLALLRRHAPTLPPSLVKSLGRWEERGTEVRLEHVLVLRMSSPDLLQSLRSSRAARFLGDPLGPTAVIVRPGAWKKVLQVLAEMGYLAEGEIEGEAD